MNFRTVNKFNVVVNALSGNCFPLNAEKRGFSFGITIYFTLVWIIKFVSITSAVIGSIKFVPGLKALQGGAVPGMNALEIIIISIYLHSRRKHLRILIRKMNDILVDSDDLRQCLKDTIEPKKKSFTLYTIMAMASTVMWATIPLFKILQNDRFSYDDYTVPAYLPGEPFNVKIFVCGVLLQTICGCYLTLKKISIDIYVSHFVTLLTAEYKYVRQQIAATLCREKKNEKDEISVIAALHKCVEHHCAVIETAQMLVELMAVYVSVTYIDSILKFCFLGFSFIRFGDDYFLKGIYFAYAFGLLIQVYLLCSAVQELLEASTSISDDAFHEYWHGRGRTVKNIFSMIELSNHMECRLTAFHVVDLTTPTLAAILKQAYSACLLLLRV